MGGRRRFRRGLSEPGFETRLAESCVIAGTSVLSLSVLKEQELTIGVDLGDRWSFCCVLEEAGKIILEQKVPTTRNRIAERAHHVRRHQVYRCMLLRLFITSTV